MKKSNSMTNILLSFLIVVISTLIYYTQQDSPAKVISHPLTTLFNSALISLIAAFILKRIKKTEKSFFQYFSFIFLMLVLVFSIGKNAGIFMAKERATEFVSNPVNETTSKTQSYLNSDYGVSFKYPENWSQKKPQRASTLI